MASSYFRLPHQQDLPVSHDCIDQGPGELRMRLLRGWSKLTQDLQVTKTRKKHKNRQVWFEKTTGPNNNHPEPNRTQPTYQPAKKTTRTKELSTRNQRTHNKRSIHGPSSPCYSDDSADCPTVPGTVGTGTSVFLGDTQKAFQHGQMLKNGQMMSFYSAFCPSNLSSQMIFKFNVKFLKGRCTIYRTFWGDITFANWPNISQQWCLPKKSFNHIGRFTKTPCYP